MFWLRNKKIIFWGTHLTKDSEYDQEIPQSQTADNPIEGLFTPLKNEFSQDGSKFQEFVRIERYLFKLFSRDSR